jgi:potassium-transporting ATPase KdpC subunit
MANTLIADFRTALISMVFFTVLCGAAYPLLMTGFAQAVFPGKANGSIVEQDGKSLGSGLVGQNFSEPQYFHPRPSAAGEDGYDGGASSGSNLGPSSQELADRVEESLAAIRKANGLGPNDPVPVDAVTASGSGLDPHISPAYAELQIPRVADDRGMTEDEVRDLVKKHTNGSTLFVMGEPRVNVLLLNLELDRGAR